MNWRTDWRPGGQEEAWIGTPGREKRIQRKKLKKVGRAPRFLSSLEAIAGAISSLSPLVEKGQQLTPPAKGKLFIDWVTYHNAQGSHVRPLLGCVASGVPKLSLHPVPLPLLASPQVQRSLRRLQGGQASLSTGTGRPGLEQVGDPLRGLLPLIGGLRSQFSHGRRETRCLPTFTGEPGKVK